MAISQIRTEDLQLRVADAITAFAGSMMFVYLRTALGTVPAQLGDGIADVAFEVDHHGEFSRDGWDVTVKGSAARVEDSDLVKRVGADPRLRPWAGGERTQVIELTVHSIDGRRVHSH